MKFLSSEHISFETSYEGDFFNNRKQYGDNLKKFINKVEDGCVISIDGKWGEGKTTFAHWWVEDLKNEHCPVYFDAFEHDFNSDPFLSLIETLFSQFSETPNFEKQFKDLMNKLRCEIIPSILSFSASSLAAFASNAPEIAAIGLKACGDLAVNISKRKNIKTLESSIKEFRETLESITTKLYLEHKKKIIFVIDELDRCRPSFAVEVIEKIKHFFSVSGIIWVLILNRDQLEMSIRHIYGEINTSLYLSKFIDVNSSLPKINRQERDLYNSDHYKCMLDKILKKSNLNGNLADIIIPQIKFFTMALRDVQKVIRNIELVYDKENNDSNWYLEITSYLAVIKESRYDLYKKIKSKEITSDELIREISFLNDPLFPLKRLQAYLPFVLCKNSGEVNATCVSMKDKDPSGFIVEFIRDWNFKDNCVYVVKDITDKMDIISFEN